MSKIKPDKINFDKDDFVVDNSFDENGTVTSGELKKNRLDAASNEIIEKAQQKAQEILRKAEEEKKTIEKDADEIIKKAREEAEKISKELCENSKEEIEKQRVDSANLGYQEGYKDGESKLYEELEEKIQALDNFCAKQTEIKNKILKSASKDILDIILNISKKVLLKEIDGEALKKIIQKTIVLFEKKENINIILSEKYARILFEYQKKSFNEEIEFNFEDFKQFENFKVLYNPKLNDDTIIIENAQERFDASINAQLDIIMRDIFESSSNGQIEDVEQLKEDET